MSKRAFWLLLTSALILSAVSSVSADNTLSEQTRTWKTVDELSPQELREVDLSTNTPRHQEVPYLPAESYPFTAPYTAEEMGYRAMEFTQRPRWSSVFANVWGSISPQGVLLSPGRSVTFMNYAEPGGVAAEFARKPGEELYRYLNQNTFPPDAEGSQRMTIRYRTDQTFVKKEESFMYSPSIRRVRHQTPGRRQDKFPNQAQGLDDATGRDAWEFSWKLIGTDVLYQTVRFPVTRPTLVLGNTGDGRLHEVRTADIKLMGNAYSHYTADGGVECYVVEARAREDWLPGYYVPRILYWLDKHSFYPLRTEQYGPDGQLTLVEVRLTDMFNPTLGDRGYGPLLIVYWDVSNDIMTYMSRDNHRLRHWTPEEGELFFNPDFMRRQWYLEASVKTQVDVFQPEQFFLRPVLEERKFPTERHIQLSPEIAARFQAQEAAGRLVFEIGQTPPVAMVAAETTPVVKKTEADKATPEDAAVDAYVQQVEQTPPTTLR
jgi:hypothetical protein